MASRAVKLPPLGDKPVEVDDQGRLLVARDDETQGTRVSHWKAALRGFRAAGEAIIIYGNT